MPVETRFHAITMQDGTVAIMQTVKQPDNTWPTAEECIAKWHPDTQAKVVTHTNINPEDIPQDREYRGAWELQGDVIGHNMDKAKDIYRDRLREARAPLLSQLDVSYMQADEAGDAKAKADVVAQKQALRDVTDDPAIDAATTIEELKAVQLKAIYDAATFLTAADAVADVGAVNVSK